MHGRLLAVLVFMILRDSAALEVSSSLEASSSLKAMTSSKTHMNKRATPVVAVPPAPVPPPSTPSDSSQLDSATFYSIATDSHLPDADSMYEDALASHHHPMRRAMELGVVHADPTMMNMTLVRACRNALPPRRPSLDSAPA